MITAERTAENKVWVGNPVTPATKALPRTVDLFDRLRGWSGATTMRSAPVDPFLKHRWMAGPVAGSVRSPEKNISIRDLFGSAREEELVALAV